VASRAVRFANPKAELRPVLVDGAAGVVVMVDGEPFSIMGFTVRGDRVAEVDVLADPDRLAALDLSAID
jgi:RNA polymerase sigma-70 factor (ECF subfamily)